MTVLKKDKYTIITRTDKTETDAFPNPVNICCRENVFCLFCLCTPEYIGPDKDRLCA